MTNNPWGDKCYFCGAQPTGNEWGIIGPLNGVKEQYLICKNCVVIIKKYRKSPLSTQTI